MSAVAEAAERRRRILCGDGFENVYGVDNEANRMSQTLDWIALADDHPLVRTPPAEVAEAREVLSKMTPGEWQVKGNDVYVACIDNLGEPGVYEIAESTHKNDLLGIAYLRNNAERWLTQLTARAVPVEVPPSILSMAQQVIEADKSGHVRTIEYELANYVRSLAEGKCE